MNINEAINIVNTFKNVSLKDKLKELEKLDKTISIDNYETIFLAANVIKKASAQIDEIVHTSGIMIALSVWLLTDEKVEYLSLGAGNHKANFDLETNLRIAEFKFGKWNEGGANGVRRRGYFSNYVSLLTSDDHRDKYFVIEDKEAFLNFMKGKASWKNVLSKNPSVLKKLETFLEVNSMRDAKTISEIYLKFEKVVTIVDFKEIITKTSI